jgi:hypothetical protein
MDIFYYVMKSIAVKEGGSRREKIGSPWQRFLEL